MTERWRRVLSLDIRSLALFRILLGINLLVDLLTRLPFIDDFYTDRGILPRAAIIVGLSDSWAPSIHLMSGEWAVQFGLFLLAICAAIGMIVGYRTRVCTVVSWFLFASMQARNPLVNYYADSVLQALLFWGMFVPLNGRWSLDGLLNSGSSEPDVQHSSWGAQALILQICFIYWFAGAMKWHPSWLSEASGVYYALSFDFAATSIGKSLLGFPKLLRLLTRSTVAVELLGPLLVLSPVWTGRCRLLAVLIFVGFHTSLALAMRLAGFSAVCVTAWMVFLPDFVWEKVTQQGSDLDSMWIRGRERVTRWAGAKRNQSDAWRRVLTPPPPKGQFGAASQAIVFVALLLVLACNFLNFPVRAGTVPSLWKRVASIAGLNQQWAMFAAPPLVNDGWFVMEGVLMSGRRVDLWLGGREATYVKPTNVAAVFGNPKWRPYLLRLGVARYAKYRGYFGDYLCRTWNKHHSGSERVNVIYINFMLEKTVPPGQPQTPATKELISRHYCFDKPPGW